MKTRESYRDILNFDDSSEGRSDDVVQEDDDDVPLTQYA